jgi:hypothetical protein
MVTILLTTDDVICIPSKTSFIFVDAEIAVLAVEEPLPKYLTVSVSVSDANDPVDMNLMDVDKSLPVIKKAVYAGIDWFMASTVIDAVEGV